MLYKIEINEFVINEGMLESLNIAPLYTIESEDRSAIIVAELNQEQIAQLQNASWVKNMIQEKLEIDWELQWQQHAEAFYDGCAHISLKPYGYNETIQLLAGPGFGDLSHPTTQLMLELMAGKVVLKNVYDIGSGSGILSLAAAAMGAKQIEGVDIDPAAIDHAQRNLALSGYSHVAFKLPQELELFEKPIALMNMIWSEQKEAYQSFIKCGGHAVEWITSGILFEEKEKYLEWAATQGWQLVEERHSQGWCAFYFLFNR